MCPLSLSYQKTSRLASNICLQGFSHLVFFFFFSPALLSIDWWWKAEVGSGVSVDATGYQSIVLVPVYRQQLWTGRWGNAGAREVQFCFPPFLPLLLCHQTSPPQTLLLFSSLMLCLYSFPADLRVLCLLFLICFLLHLGHPGPSSYAVMTENQHSM